MSNVKTAEEIYQSLGQEIFEGVEDEEWIEAFVDFDYKGSSGGGPTRYLDKNKLEKNLNCSGSTLFKNFEALNQLMTSDAEYWFESKNRWNKARFTLWPDGKFDIKFDWDQERFDEIQMWHVKLNKRLRQDLDENIQKELAKEIDQKHKNGQSWSEIAIYLRATKPPKVIKPRTIWNDRLVYFFHKYHFEGDKFEHLD